jgi:hypothetical protein
MDAKVITVGGRGTRGPKLYVPRKLCSVGRKAVFQYSEDRLDVC